jgi:hypothetical protein
MADYYRTTTCLKCRALLKFRIPGPGEVAPTLASVPLTCPVCGAAIAGPGFLPVEVVRGPEVSVMPAVATIPVRPPGAP